MGVTHATHSFPLCRSKNRSLFFISFLFQNYLFFAESLHDIKCIELQRYISSVNHLSAGFVYLRIWEKIAYVLHRYGTIR